MDKLLAIVGPTGTGKTDLALKLSRLFPSVLVSADSRQVYRKMDIVTGKDHPKDYPIYGLDLVSPDQACSVSVWAKVVQPIIRQSWLRGEIPIVVGGTGLYLRALTEGISTISIPPSLSLRSKLSRLTTRELQIALIELNPAKWQSMNHSDRHNPRRLIRALEITQSKPEPRRTSLLPNTLFIGLRYSDLEQYSRVIKSRVQTRLKKGALAETKQLLASYSPTLPAFSSLGYRYLIQYLNHEITKKTLINLWIQEELAYAKRQLTWFNKLVGVHWFNPDQPDFSSQVASLVKDWYSNS